MRAALAALASVLAFSGQAAPPAERPAQAWRADAARDLDAVHDTLADNAPFMVVGRDSKAMRRWLELGLVEAKQGLPTVHDGRSYLALLRRYAGGFRDGHISIRADAIASDARWWTGFTLAWQGGAYRVAYVAPVAAVDPPPMGAVLLGCDGKSAEDIARQALDRVQANLNLEAARARSAYRLLRDYGDPQAPRAESCTFATPEGDRTWRLLWRELDQAQASAAYAAVGEPAAQFNVTRWGANAWWIGAPTMTGEEDWKAIYDKVDASRDAIRKADVVVIDLRGNGGGNSDFGEQLAIHLWNQPLVQANEKSSGPLVFKAGPLSRQWIHGAEKLFENHPEALAEVKPMIARLDAAPLGSKVVISTDANAPPSRTPPSNPMRAQVVMLVDHACFSACLDTLDIFTSMPGVRVAGTETGADTIFMDIMTSPLPSGQAKLGFGIKAWSGRPRGSNVPYKPSAGLSYTGSLSNEAGLKAWLAARLGVGGL